MADTTFVNNVTLTDADWFNDVNRLHYTILGDPSTLADLISNTLVSTGMPFNHGLSASVASNALTINLTTKSGGTPSSSSPVVIPFRSATTTTGTITPLAVTAATSITISSGSTLGTISDSLVRVWVVGFNDDGTFRLGVINCLKSGDTSPSIYTLRPDVVASSVQDAGLGFADSSATFYTNSAAVSSKPFCILGYVECEIVTAGTWTTPTNITPIRYSTPLPGTVLAENVTLDSAVATNTGTVPNDNTTPLNTEGSQFMSLTLSAPAVEGVWELEHVGNYASSNTDNGIQVFACLGNSGLGSSTDALVATRAGRPATAGAVTTATLKYRLPVNSSAYDSPGVAFPGTTALAAIRAGTSTAGTTTFNGSAGAGLYNGTYYSSLILRSIMY